MGLSLRVWLQNLVLRMNLLLPLLLRGRASDQAEALSLILPQVPLNRLPHHTRLQPVQGSGFRVQGVGFRVRGSGGRVRGVGVG